MRRLPRLLGALALSMVAACGGGGDLFGEPSVPTVGITDVPTSAPDSTTEPTGATTAPATTTAVGPATTTTSTSAPPASTTTTTEAPPTTFPGYVDFEALLDAIGDEPVGDPVSALGGPPDRAATEELTADLAAAGLDLTGMTVWVWPVTGTDTTVVVLDIDAATATMDARSDAQETLITSLLFSPILDDAGVERVAITYRAEDAGGPFSVMISVDLEAARTSVSTGIDLTPDQIVYELTREG